MKTIITIAITLIVVIPVIGYTASGMIEYQALLLNGGWDGSVTKMYDHDEGIVCYAYSTGYAGGISCLKD